MKNKISLANDIFNSIKIKKQKDERIEAEKNKGFCMGYNVLVLILIVFAIINDTFDFKIESSYISLVIGIISYVILLFFCKRVAITDNDGSFVIFIWSILNLPISIINISMDILALINRPLIFLSIPIGIIVAVIMYFIANTVYQKAMSSD